MGKLTFQSSVLDEQLHESKKRKLNSDGQDAVVIKQKINFSCPLCITHSCIIFFALQNTTKGKDPAHSNASSSSSDTTFKTKDYSSGEQSLAERREIPMYYYLVGPGLEKYSRPEGALKVTLNIIYGLSICTNKCISI